MIESNMTSGTVHFSIDFRFSEQDQDSKLFDIISNDVIIIYLGTSFILLCVLSSKYTLNF